jgi:hypothetical protein
MRLAARAPCRWLPLSSNVMRRFACSFCETAGPRLGKPSRVAKALASAGLRRLPAETGKLGLSVGSRGSPPVVCRILNAAFHRWAPPFSLAGWLSFGAVPARELRAFCWATHNLPLNRSANGRPPGPDRWYAVHFPRPGPGGLPSSPG